MDKCLGRHLVIQGIHFSRCSLDFKLYPMKKMVAACPGCGRITSDKLSPVEYQDVWATEKLKWKSTTN